MSTQFPALKSKFFLLFTLFFLLICQLSFSQKKPRLVQETPISTTAISKDQIADVSSISYANVIEKIYRDQTSHAVIKTESNYNYSLSGGGQRRDVTFFNIDGKPSYINSQTFNKDGALTYAIERIEVIKGIETYAWNNNDGVISAIKYLGAEKNKETLTAPQTYQPYYQPPVINFTGMTPIKNDDWISNILKKINLGTFSETLANSDYGKGGSAFHDYKPFEGFKDIETETVQYKDLIGVVRKEIYREYYKDGWMYEEVTYYDCNGKKIHFDSSIFDDYGDEWEYMELEFVNGQPVAGYRDIADEDEEGYYEFREYYNPFKDRFEEDPSGDPAWSDYDDFSFDSGKLDDPCCNSKRFHVFIGPSLIMEDYSDDEKFNMWGIKAELTRYFSCKIGATVDVGYNFGTIQETDYSKLNLLAGLTWAPNEKWGLDKKFTFSLHALAGVQFLKSKYEFMGYSDEQKNTAFTAAVGPRLDFKLKDKLYVGAGAEYMPVFGEDKTANNYRFFGGVRLSF